MVTRHASAPTVASMTVSNGESTAELVPTKAERKVICMHFYSHARTHTHTTQMSSSSLFIQYVRSFSDGGENKVHSLCFPL